MPLPDKSRIATCSATCFCLSRGHPLDPVSHTVTQSVNLGQISSRIHERSFDLFSGVFVVIVIDPDIHIKIKSGI